MLLLFFGFASAWIIPGLGWVGAIGSVLVLSGFAGMWGGAGGLAAWLAVLLLLRACARCGTRARD